MANSPSINTPWPAAATGTSGNFWAEKLSWAGPVLTLMISLWVLFQYAYTQLSVLVGALLIAYLLETPVLILTRGVKRLVPHWVGPRRWVSVSLATLLLLAVFSNVVTWLVPLLLQQLNTFLQTMPDYMAQLDSNVARWLHVAPGWLQDLPFDTPENLKPQTHGALTTDPPPPTWLVDGWRKLVQATETSAVRLGNSVGELLSGTLNMTVSVIATLVLVYQFLLASGKIQAACVRLAPKSCKQSLHTFFIRLNQVMRAFVRGQVLLGLLTGLYMLIVLSVFNVPFALLLAVIFGICDVIPVIGTWMGVIPTLLVTAMTQSPMTVVYVWLCSYVYQSVKDNILQPKILGDVLGLHPILTMLALLVGVQLGGGLGLIIAIPAAALLRLYRLEPKLKTS
ncbi:MAG: AI-2E family transporter [Vampirovibrionales bacterium]|nr:AI-2E family transporter [Vampirovibrionales bacterium]